MFFAVIKKIPHHRFSIYETHYTSVKETAALAARLFSLPRTPREALKNPPQANGAYSFANPASSEGSIPIFC
jgi:hypothetical protein